MNTNAFYNEELTTSFETFLQGEKPSIIKQQSTQGCNPKFYILINSTSFYYPYVKNRNLDFKKAKMEINKKYPAETKMEATRFMSQNNATPCEFYPDAVPEQWDNVEVGPVFDNGKGEIEPCEEGEESYWSIYLHEIDGGLQCVADCQTKDQAQALYTLLTKTVQNYKDNGYLNP